MKRLCLAVLVGTTLTAAMPEPAARADTIVVPCSTSALVSAITSAPAGSTLNLAHACNYGLTSVNNIGARGPNGLPVIAKQLTIEGNRATISRVGGFPSFRVFEIAPSGNLDLRTATISGGLASCTGSKCQARGGGILNLGMLSLTSSQLTSNAATCSDTDCGASGGGLEGVVGSSAFFGNALVSSNTATCSGANCEVYGGGIDTNGSLLIQSSQLSSNAATCSTNCVAFGGGILASTAGLTLHSSVVSSNSASGAGADGGGVWRFGNPAKATQTSISGNTPNNCAPPGSVPDCVG
jgi:hypothetical protein